MDEDFRKWARIVTQWIAFLQPRAFRGCDLSFLDTPKVDIPGTMGKHNPDCGCTYCT